MDLVDKFLATVIDECGKSIDFSNVEVEGFEGVVCFGQYYADVKITESEFIFHNTLLTKYQRDMVIAFKDYVQQKMKESREYFENNKIK